MTNAIPRIPWKGSRAVITLTWDELSEIVAHAQEAGYSAAMNDAGVEDRERNRLVTNYWASFATRAHLVAASFRKIGHK